jgi:hypothetical protein
MSSIEDLRSASSSAGKKRWGSPTGKTVLVSKWHPTQGITKVEESSRQKSMVAVTGGGRGRSPGESERVRRLGVHHLIFSFSFSTHSNPTNDSLLRSVFEICEL